MEWKKGKLRRRLKESGKRGRDWKENGMGKAEKGEARGKKTMLWKKRDNSCERPGAYGIRRERKAKYLNKKHFHFSYVGKQTGQRKTHQGDFLMTLVTPRQFYSEVRYSWK